MRRLPDLFHFRVGPASGHAVFEGKGLVQRVLEDLLRGPDHCAGDRVGDHGAHCDGFPHRGLDTYLEVLGFGTEIDRAVHQDLGRRSLDLEVLRFHHAARDGELAADAIEGEAVTEDVAEVERDSARQGLQAEYAEQAADARFELDELAAGGIELEAAIERQVIQREGRAVP